MALIRIVSGKIKKNTGKVGEFCQRKTQWESHVGSVYMLLVCVSDSVSFSGSVSAPLDVEYHRFPLAHFTMFTPKEGLKKVLTIINWVYSKVIL